MAVKRLKIAVSLVVYRSDNSLLAKAIESVCQEWDRLKAHWPEVEGVFYLVENDPELRANAQFIERELKHRLEQSFARLAVFTPDANLGYGRGHNLSLIERNCAYHLILNPDVELCESGLFAALEFADQHPAAVLITPRGVSENNALLSLCKTMPSVFDLLLRGFAPVALKKRFKQRLDSYERRDLDNLEEPVENIVIASGCCMLIRTEALLKVGGFDERFFLYFEDFDLSLRLKNQGKLVYFPAMKIVHHGGDAANKGINHIVMFAISAFKFFQKHGWKFR